MLQNQGVNKIILVGNVQGQPEWHTRTNGKYLSFQLITVEDINRQGEVYQHHENHIVRMPESIVENSGNGIEDGVALYIEGKITTRPTIDGMGIKRYNTAIVVSKYTMMAKTSAQVLNTI